MRFSKIEKKMGHRIGFYVIFEKLSFKGSFCSTVPSLLSHSQHFLLHLVHDRKVTTLSRSVGVGVHTNQTTNSKMLKHQFHSHFQVRNYVSLRRRVIIKGRKYQFISKKKHELPSHAQNGVWTCVVNCRPFK